MQNGTFQNHVSLDCNYILMCKHYFNMVTGKGAANRNRFIYC